jgi:hypothetical protein
MKLLCLVSLAATPLVAQTPQEGVKIPREPSTGIAKVHEPPVVKDGVAATLGLPVPAQETRPSSRATANPAVVRDATEGIARQFADPEFVAFDRAPDGTLWVAANSYKSAFGANGWQFVGKPAPEAPDLAPIGLRLVGATVGAQPLALADAWPSQKDRRFSYDRGALVENIDVNGRGVEQTFVFDRLAQRGEIVLRIAVATALTAQNTADGGVEFRGPFDHVTYSAAIAIDANGQRIGAPTSYADGAITVRVPASFVERAALPLVIDPLLSTVVVYPSTVDVGEPDIAWDETGQVWAVAFMRLFGGSDWDVYVQRTSLGSPQTLVGGLTTIDVTTDPWFAPRIANLNVYDTFMVVCQARPGTGPWQIEGRQMANSGTLLTGQFVIHTSSVDEIRPDIGGDSFSPPTYFTVVWEHSYSTTDHDIYARQVDATGALRGTGVTVIQGNTTNQSWPSISKSDGGSNAGTQRYAIVYQQTFSASDEDIYGAMLTWDGNFVPVGGSNTFAIDTSVANDVLPQVSSPTLQGSNGLRQLLAVYQRTGVNNGDIVATCFGSNGAIYARGNVTQLEGNATRLAWPQSRPSVDSDGRRFVVGYHEVYNNNTTTNDLDTRYTMIARTGGALFAEEAGITLGYSGNREFNMQVAGRYSGTGAYSPDFNSANDRDGIPSGGLNIDAYAFTAAARGLFVTRTTACGTHTINASGDAVLGGTITFGSSPTPFIPGFVLGGAASNPVGPCPGCTLGVDGFLAVGSGYVVVVPTDTALLGAQFSAQGFVFQNSGAPCINQIQLTDTIDVTIG